MRFRTEEWFNQVDAQYRSDLRELNELNFARFDAKVGQRFAETDSRVAQQFATQTRFLYDSLVAQLALIAGLYLR